MSLSLFKNKLQSIDNITIVLMLTGTTMMSFVHTFTSPSVHLYFMKIVDQRTYAASQLLTCFLTILVNLSVPVDSIKAWYRRNFHWIVTIDVVCFCAVSYLSMEYYYVRFIGLAILTSVSSHLWFMIIRDSINHVISGDELTNYMSFCQSFDLTASLLGGILAIIFVELPVEYCILAQCVVNLVFGVTDYIAFKRLNILAKSRVSQERVS